MHYQRRLSARAGFEERWMTSSCHVAVVSPWDRRNRWDTLTKVVAAGPLLSFPRRVRSGCSSQMNSSSVSKKDVLLQINLSYCSAWTPGICALQLYHQTLASWKYGCRYSPEVKTKAKKTRKRSHKAWCEALTQQHREGGTVTKGSNQTHKQGPQKRRHELMRLWHSSATREVPLIKLSLRAKKTRCWNQTSHTKIDINKEQALRTLNFVRPG